MSKTGDLIISVLGGLITFVLLQAVAYIASIPIESGINYKGSIVISGHFVAVSCLVILFLIVGRSSPHNEQPIFTFLAGISIIILISIPIAYYFSFFVPFSFLTVVSVAVSTFLIMGVVWVMTPANNYDADGSS
jgi:hypothetical protein